MSQNVSKKKSKTVSKSKQNYSYSRSEAYSKLIELGYSAYEADAIKSKRYYDYYVDLLCANHEKLMIVYTHTNLAEGIVRYHNNNKNWLENTCQNLNNLIELKYTTSQIQFLFNYWRLRKDEYISTVINHTKQLNEKGFKNDDILNMLGEDNYPHLSFEYINNSPLFSKNIFSSQQVIGIVQLHCGHIYLKAIEEVVNTHNVSKDCAQLITELTIAAEENMFRYDLYTNQLLAIIENDISQQMEKKTNSALSDPAYTSISAVNTTSNNKRHRDEQVTHDERNEVYGHSVHKRPSVVTPIADIQPLEGTLDLPDMLLDVFKKQIDTKSNTDANTVGIHTSKTETSISPEYAIKRLASPGIGNLIGIYSMFAPSNSIEHGIDREKNPLMVTVLNEDNTVTKISF